ncbi:MAG TPA: hypothetical protein P5205_05820 [Candidatus Paceibacterota bacterium]|nr:hypothetical protein [Verrucomicrobiota bacterium]HSA09871.1 hypothetical protein [Candidatus Paceibacterota bacterium]
MKAERLTKAKEINMDSIWANYLRQALARSGLNGRQVSAIMAKYSNLCARTTAEAAFTETLDSYGSEDVPTAVNKIKTELERLNQQKLDVNPVTRLRKTIERFNKNVDKCSVEVSGIDERRWAEHKRRIKLKLPEFAKEKTFTALGNFQGRTAKLELSVIL